MKISCYNKILYFVLVVSLSCPGLLRAADDGLSGLLAGDWRPPQEVERDRYRHPLETLHFFGLFPEAKVVELWPGRGWYTALLAPYLRDHGQLTVASFGDEAEPPFRARLHREYLQRLAARPEIYGKVRVVILNPPQEVDLGYRGEADFVLTFRNLHNWIMDGTLDEVFAAAFRALRPGGVFGVVEHRAPEGGDIRTWVRRGYVPEAYVIEQAQAAGFELQERSELNANPVDSKDHPEGVWTLPPTLKLGDKDRERYQAIGESDRMTLRFVKPLSPP